MYIPTWADVPILILSYLIGYELYRKEPSGQSIHSNRFRLMAISVILSAVISIVNRNETVLSVPFFAVSVLCLGWAVYQYATKPKKPPIEPLLD